MLQKTHSIGEQPRLQQWLASWNLLVSLVSRDIRARYRRTFLGPLWAIIPPILATAMYSFLGGLVDVDTQGAPRLAFTFAATVPWAFLSSTVLRIPHGVLSNGNLLRKMPMPRQLLPLVVVLTTFFDFLMSGIVLLVALQLFRIPISLQWLWLPVLVFMAGLLGWAVGIGIAAFTIYRRDMLYGIQHVMQVWLILTPVIYDAQELSTGPWLEIIRGLNPAVGIIDGFRRVLIFGQAPQLSLLLGGLLVTVLGLCISFPLYDLMSRYYADVV